MHYKVPTHLHQCSIMFYKTFHLYRIPFLKRSFSLKVLQIFHRNRAYLHQHTNIYDATHTKYTDANTWRKGFEHKNKIRVSFHSLVFV